MSSETSTNAVVLSKPSLLGIPAELRNNIYRLALIKDKRIDISYWQSEPTEPGLLQVCRQTRAESKEIYFKENKFFITVEGADATEYVKWAQLSELHKKADCDACLTGDDVFASHDLEAWLKAFYEGECERSPMERDRGGPVTNVFALVVKLRDKYAFSWDQTWDVVEDVCDCL